MNQNLISNKKHQDRKYDNIIFTIIINQLYFIITIHVIYYFF